MPAPSASSATAVPPDQSPLGWLILLPLACLILGQALLSWSGGTPVFDGTLADPDSYMRLNRVLALHDGGAWSDSRELRINPPAGHVQHWTRPLDAALYAGAWLLQPAFGFARALHVAGVLFSPLMLALCVIALGWASAPLLDRDSRLFACLALLMQPTVLAYSSLGRPDHHTLLLLLFILFIGLILRLLDGPAPRRLALAAGAVAALGVWISPETLAFIAPGLAALGLGWLGGRGSLAPASRDLLASATLGLALALLIERGPAALSALENDRLSLVHVTLFALLGLFWTLAPHRRDQDRALFWRPHAARLARHSGPPARRAEPPAAPWPGLLWRTVVAGAGVAGLAALMLMMFPALQQGPLGAVDPLYDQLRLERIVEIQPLVPRDMLSPAELGHAANRLILIIGIAFVALPFLLALAALPGPARHLWLAMALVLAVFVPLAFYQVRWSSYAQVALVVPYSAALGWLMQRLAGRLPRGAPVLCRPLSIVAGLFWPLLLGQAFPQQQIETADRGCPIARVAPALARAGDGARGTVLAMADYGPEILYRTARSVLSIPNHRPQPGFAATWRILTATDPAAARAELEHAGVDLVLLCPNPVEREVFGGAERAGANLYRRLVDGASPAWLRPVALPPEVADAARLFAFVPGPTGSPAAPVPDPGGAPPPPAAAPL